MVCGAGCWKRRRHRHRAARLARQGAARALVPVATCMTPFDTPTAATVCPTASWHWIGANSPVQQCRQACKRGLKRPCACIQAVWHDRRWQVRCGRQEEHGGRAASASGIPCRCRSRPPQNPCTARRARVGWNKLQRPVHTPAQSEWRIMKRRAAPCVLGSGTPALPGPAPLLGTLMSVTCALLAVALLPAAEGQPNSNARSPIGTNLAAVVDWSTGGWSAPERIRCDVCSGAQPRRRHCRCLKHQVRCKWGHPWGHPSAAAAPCPQPTRLSTTGRATRGPGLLPAPEPGRTPPAPWPWTAQATPPACCRGRCAG